MEATPENSKEPWADVKFTAKILMFGPDGIVRKFTEKHVKAMTLVDPNNKTNLWRIRNDGKPEVPDNNNR